jgi:hypothetical protein
MFDHEWETIPTNLDDLQPGPELGGVLACIDVDDVSSYDKVTVLRAHQRQRSFHDAEYYRAMASVTRDLQDDHPQHGFDAAAAEIQCALHLTRRATETELSFALELHNRLPQVWEALSDGTIDVRRAKTFSHCTTHLPDPVARLAVERVIDSAGGLTTGELKARLDRIVIEADPGGAQERYQHAVKTRRLITEPTPDGTANLLVWTCPHIWSQPCHAESTTAPQVSKPKTNPAPWTSCEPTSTSTCSSVGLLGQRPVAVCICEWTSTP